MPHIPSLTVACVIPDQDQPAAGDRVEGRGPLREQHRMLILDRQHPGASSMPSTSRNATAIAVSRSRSKGICVLHTW